MFYVSLQPGSCPKGYMYIEGSGSANLEASHSLAADLCEEKCSLNDLCNGFEVNADLGTCQLDTLVGPSNPPVAGQVFCSKLCKFRM